MYPVPRRAFRAAGGRRLAVRPCAPVARLRPRRRGWTNRRTNPRPRALPPRPRPCPAPRPLRAVAGVGPEVACLSSVYGSRAGPPLSRAAAPQSHLGRPAQAHQKRRPRAQDRGAAPRGPPQRRLPLPPGASAPAQAPGLGDVKSWHDLRRRAHAASGRAALSATRRSRLQPQGIGRHAPRDSRDARGGKTRGMPEDRLLRRFATFNVRPSRVIGVLHDRVPTRARPPFIRTTRPMPLPSTRVELSFFSASRRNATRVHLRGHYGFPPYFYAARRARRLPPRRDENLSSSRVAIDCGVRSPPRITSDAHLVRGA